MMLLAAAERVGEDHRRGFTPVGSSSQMSKRS